MSVTYILIDNIGGNLSIPFDVGGSILVQEVKVSPLVILYSFIEEVTKDDRMQSPVKSRLGIQKLDEKDQIISKGPSSFLSNQDISQFYN